MGTPKTTKNKPSRDGKSKEEKSKEKKTATKKKLNVDDKQVQKETKKINNKKKDNSSSKNNGTFESKIRKQSNGNPNDSGNKRKRKEKNEEEEEEEDDNSKLLNVFPMHRVQRIAKSEGSDFKMSQEAYFLINKATEKFIGQFCEDAYDSAPPRDRRGFFKYRHLSSIVCTEKRYDFLSDFVPEKIKVEDALKEIKPEEEPSSASTAT